MRSRRQAHCGDSSRQHDHCRRRSSEERKVFSFGSVVASGYEPVSLTVRLFAASGRRGARYHFVPEGAGAREQYGEDLALAVFASGECLSMEYIISGLLGRVQTKCGGESISYEKD